jgi:hypothetical protein
MTKQTRLKGRKLLLMGSKAFRSARLPARLAKKIDEAITRRMKIIVGEAPGACRLFQDYLQAKGYKNVLVGHAKSIRYNAGDWKTKQYGDSVSERERKMIKEVDSAVAIWQDASGVIAENLELLKLSGKPTFVYEFSNRTRAARIGWLDPKRVYDPYFYWKEKMREEKRRRR